MFGDKNNQFHIEMKIIWSFEQYVRPKINNYQEQNKVKAFIIEISSNLQMCWPCYQCFNQLI